jgi:exodeoxyribonuclease V alpha subunit
MIDAPLMGHFLAAMPDYGHLVLVGDTDQLPSVGPGNVLRDLIDSNTIPYRRLETIYRQEEGSLIVRNAHHVNRGEPLEIPPSDKPSDFYFIACEQPDDVVARMLDLVTRRIPRKFGFNPLTDIQVLTPMRRNQLGADNLNGVLQEALNPKGAEIQRFGRKYRVGDRVMQIRNNYDRDVFNGDVGSIEKVDPEEHALAVRFDDRPVIYDFEDLDELVHAYACSIHKSQGSEYPATVVLLSTQHYKLLQRNLLYTALTRGKRLVCLVASHKAVHIAIKNNEIRLRRTALAERLRARLAPVPGQRRLPDPEEA